MTSSVFDFLQDCVAIGAVLALVVVMTADDEDAATVAATQSAAISQAPLDAATSDALARLDAELREQLAAPIIELEEPRQTPVIEASTPAGKPVAADPFAGAFERFSDAVEVPTDSVPIVRAVPPLPDASDYTLSNESLLPDTLPWQKPAVPRADAPGRRRGGVPPAASRPLIPRAMQPLSAPPVDEADDSLSPFGSSIDTPDASDVARGPRAPQRLR